MYSILYCGICDLCSRLVDLFFSFIACLVHHIKETLPATLTSSSASRERKKMSFLNFPHRLKMARFIFVSYLLLLLWKSDLFIYSFFFCLYDQIFSFSHTNMLSIWQQKLCDSHTITLTLSADYYSSFISCSLFLIYVPSF